MTEPDVTTDANAESSEPKLERATYEIVRDRLVTQASELRDRAEALNAKRLELFGGSEFEVVGSLRIRTENNCVPRDVAQVGDTLLFGYNVFIGLKKETEVDDVFVSQRFVEKDDGSFSFEEAPAPFLEETSFVTDFRELYTYYAGAKLLQLRKLGGRLLAIFQTGATVHDNKVLRWAVDPQGKASYQDNRGERDHVFETSHDFEWTKTTRDDHVQGAHPHVEILGEVFVETVGGDLTVKVEDNTEDGLGIYREPVEDADQSLDDAEVEYAALGNLILIRLLPFREETWRYLVFNRLTKKVQRIDAVGLACQQLPEDHGVIFPGGYYLRSGETKVFDTDTDDLEFVKRIRSPNGEDVLYVFHHRNSGRFLLLPYNMLRKEVLNPVDCHGYSLFDSGRMIVLRDTSDEPTRVHTMQVWQTPFCSEVFAAQGTSAAAGTYLEQIGNAELVRGISDALTIDRAAREESASAQLYEDLIRNCNRTLDSYHWLGHEEAGGLAESVDSIRATAELVVDEFEKVQALRRQSSEALAQAEQAMVELERELQPTSWSDATQFTDALARLRRQRGELITLRDLRYVDAARLDELEQRNIAHFDDISQRTVAFLGDEEALKPYHERIAELESSVEAVKTVKEADELSERTAELEEALRILTEIVSGLEVDDATLRAALLERISEVMAGINRLRALGEGRRRELRSREATAEFGAEFRLFSQAASSAIHLAKSPEECDEGLARQMLGLEELESRYADFDEFLGELVTKREEIYEAFSSKKQQLLDERQQRAERLSQAADRILESVQRRGQTFEDASELNAFFASDPMVMKVRTLAEDLRELGDSVRADEIEGRIKAAQQESARGFRDRQEIFEEGDVLRLGKHRFSVNTQPFDLTLVPRGEGLALHLTGTDFYEEADTDALGSAQEVWSQALVSENESLYRAEYLSGSILRAAERGERDLSLERLHEAVETETVLELVREVAGERYDEGYERGVHDADAALLLTQLVALFSTSDLLRYPGRPRAHAVLFWAFGLDREARELLQRRAQSLVRLRQSLGAGEALARLADEVADELETFLEAEALTLPDFDPRTAGRYLVEEVGRDRLEWILGPGAIELRDAFHKSLRDRSLERQLQDDLRSVDGLAARYGLARAWVESFAATVDQEAPAVCELTALLLTDEAGLSWRESHARVSTNVGGLLGQHPRIEGGQVNLRIDRFLERLEAYESTTVPAFRSFQEKRHELLEEHRERLRLDEYQPRVMSSFVRNRLLSEVYLPLIGDNLAKQIGAYGDAKRTDLMGLLLLISPPGYGKTTVMEYVANRLGLVFVKVNGPSLGHTVTSLDPADAPNATARQEVEKINFAFELGNNVLLYLDDIQHTSSELLQKFISLCDGQRRVEGVWKGRTSTYDLRGKKFAVCMAGNPYTEAGERFQIPDMLANRADVYNLGDVLEGKDDLFALSYIENSLTSNSVMAPLAGREPKDLYRFVDMAKGEEMQTDQLSHPYSSVEVQEILNILGKLLRVQDVLLKVNQQYISSAAQDDNYRTEPPFQLQGSYRNMNKLAEKIVPVMNDDELEALLDDHYLGEAQTLTTGAEQNLLKLRELRGVLDDEESARWQQIKQGFLRARAMGGAEDDPVTRVTGTLGLLSDQLATISSSIETASATRTEQPEGPSPERLSRLVAARVDAAFAERMERRAVADARETRAENETSVEAAPRIELDLGPYVEKLQETLDALAQATVTATELSAAAPVEPSRQAALPSDSEPSPKRSSRSSGSGTTLPPTSSFSVAPAVSSEQVEAVTQQLDRLVRGMQAIGGAIANARPQGNAETVRVVQTLQPGVYDLIDELSDNIDTGVMDVLKDVSRWLKRQDVEPDARIEQLLERTLTQLDRFKDLVGALKKIDTGGLVGGESPSD
ncbi:MAG: DNA repair ATPase [Acidobacteriota bacterium]